MAVDVSTVPYTYGYFAPQSVAFLRLCALSKGVATTSGAPRYLELGIGQGVSLNVHAAADPGEYWGNDFNAEHVAHAQRMANASGASVKVVADSFAKLAVRPNLPQFDYITLHGIWSWVTDEDRAIIVDLARRHLAPGGLLYVSYNCASGWAAAQPLRDLYRAHADRASAGASHEAKIVNAMAFGRTLAAAGAMYFRANPTVALQMDGLAGRDPTYLAHEFLGANWRAMSFYEASEHFARANLQFLGSTFLLEHGTRHTLNDAARSVISSLDSAELREAAIECFINPQFRQDIFVKEPRRLTAEARLAAFRAQHFVMAVPAAEMALTIPGPLSPVSLDERVHGGIVRVLAADNYRPKSLSEIERTLGNVAIEELIEGVLALVASRQVLPATAEPSATAKDWSRALNRHILERAVERDQLTVLASPVLGAGQRAMRSEQLFLLARERGHETRKQWVDFAASEVKLEGFAPPSAELRARLDTAAEQFERMSLPLLMALGVA